mmetsp:Transcript_15007/g.24484  ORF Transcript_15007/g.24484 Transcript_15007/m.24484 type:complete len:547 (-) Transcript_15007:186-1826(-)|eukprot:CAMPEP_0198703148 /NCGR_PEP_ID=MMETSP1468-20131203/389178_1 /TAXON_ID=1461545 /ORGANISM="Mantoniella sp, Strain CCMP1436" /LENGTH=546 /DNA_ID=CAMNT_0044461801 /DNA_START=25 /DNA_END=1665 /DNA_ORIENTATION=-
MATRVGARRLAGALLQLTAPRAHRVCSARLYHAAHTAVSQTRRAVYVPAVTHGWSPAGLASFNTSAARRAASTVEVPQMGDSITEGSIAAVLKAPGDDVAVDEVIAQIETDKVTIDVRSPVAGVIGEILVKEGDTVIVGQGVATLTEGAKNAAAASPAPLTSAPAGASSAPFGIQVPSMGDSITEGAIAAIVKQPGEMVSMDETIAQIETDKVTIDVRAPVAGVVQSYMVAEGDTVTVGQEIAVFTPSAAGAAAAAPVATAAAAPPLPPRPVATATAAAAAAPAAPAAAPAPKTTVSAPVVADAAAPPAAPAGDRTESRVKMTRLRKRVAERLKSAQNTYAMLTTFNEIDMTNLMAMRSQYKDMFIDKHGVKLGFMSCFIKAASKALKAEPAVNATIDGDEIVYRNYFDISIAVSAPKGLVVPVLRDVDTMSFAGVEGSIAAFGKKARDGTLGIDEMTGGTFTISNGGVFGSLNGTPIVNPPQSAILGMHAIVMRPVVVGGEIVARPMMNVALTYDHRLVDGREAVTFLKSIKESVEDPRRLLLDL